jgi:hypothetical protein
MRLGQTNGIWRVCSGDGVIFSDMLKKKIYNLARNNQMQMSSLFLLLLLHYSFFHPFLLWNGITRLCEVAQFRLLLLLQISLSIATPIVNYNLRSTSPPSCD